MEVVEARIDDTESPLDHVVHTLCAQQGRESESARICNVLRSHWIDSVAEYAALHSSLPVGTIPAKLHSALMSHHIMEDTNEARRQDTERRAREDAVADDDDADEEVKDQNRIIDTLIALNASDAGVAGVGKNRKKLMTVTINELADLSTADGTLYVDIGLLVWFQDEQMRWKSAGEPTREQLESVMEWKPEFDITGALDLERAPQDGAYYVRERYRAHGIVSFWQRITGTMRVNLSLSSFPFDTQRLVIQLACFDWGISDCLLVLDEAKKKNLWSDDSAKHLHEWLVTETPTCVSTSIFLDSDQRDVSVLEITVPLERRTRFYTVNILLVVFLLNLLSSCLFIIDPEVLNDRLQICITCFLALVAVNFVVAESLPKINHITYLTLYFLINYVQITLGAIESTIVFLIDRYGTDAKLAAKIVDWTVLGVFVTFQVALFLLFVLFPYCRTRRRRRQQP